MAEILLCSIDGPSGFSKPVVLKRVLPRWAERSDFRSMFIDEARIVAGLRHPNVVPVIELGQDGSDLYLAMEYLDGESLDVLVRRLGQSGKRLPAHLAAYVVAEAAAGLHAAHELKDPSGRALDVVHRDVSPHNLFLGYDGSVRVIDFGIAKARDRETRTETGTVKGKFAYMSPEQIDAQPLDRRSDVFSLGVVLWELLTFKRLFQRGTHVEIVKAICFADAPLVESVDASIPGALSRIAERALRRERDDRYASAAELRRDLSAALRALPAAEDPREELSALMMSTFEERVGEKRELLRRLAAGSHITQVPLAVADGDQASGSIDIEVPDGEQPLAARPSNAPTRAEPAARQSAGARAREVTSPSMQVIAGERRPLRWLLAGLGVVALIGVGALALGARGEDEPTTRPERLTTTTTTPSPADGPTPDEPARSSEAAALEGAGPSATIEVHVESEPSGARIRIDGAERGLTPLVLQLPSATGTHDVELTLADHATSVSQISAERDASLHIALRRLRRRSTPRPEEASEETGSTTPREPTPPPTTSGGIFRVD